MTQLTNQDIRIAGGVQLAKLVVVQLRETADDLTNVWAELDGSADNILVQSEAERYAGMLTRMADRLEKKINKGLKAIA
jgi:hypothetical protein|tara:strand:+ start:224 stop:460 length:237 start_codon:yes stop_codon:yes gene_type:complete